MDAEAMVFFLLPHKIGIYLSGVYLLMEFEFIYQQRGENNCHKLRN